MLSFIKSHSQNKCGFPLPLIALNINFTQLDAKLNGVYSVVRDKQMLGTSCPGQTDARDIGL